MLDVMDATKREDAAVPRTKRRASEKQKDPSCTSDMLAVHMVARAQNERRGCSPRETADQPSSRYLIGDGAGCWLETLPMTARIPTEIAGAASQEEVKSRQRFRAGSWRRRILEQARPTVPVQRPCKTLIRMKDSGMYQ